MLSVRDMGWKKAVLSKTLSFFQRSEPLHSVLYFGRQPDSYMSSILKKLVTMNDPTKNLSRVLRVFFG